MSSARALNRKHAALTTFMYESSAQLFTSKCFSPVSDALLKCLTPSNCSGQVLSIGYNTVWSELCKCNKQTHSRQCCNLLISWPANVGDVFIEAW